MIRAHAARLGVALPTDPLGRHPRPRPPLPRSRTPRPRLRHAITSTPGPPVPPRPRRRPRHCVKSCWNLGRHLAAGAPHPPESLVARHGALFLRIARQTRHLAPTFVHPPPCGPLPTHPRGLRLSRDHYNSQKYSHSAPTRNAVAATSSRFVEFFEHHDDPARSPAEMLADLTR